MTEPSLAGRLRRDLGSLEAYAALLGILIGAGIFRVTTEAWVRTGPSVILGYIVLAVPVLATSIGYCVFLSTPLGRAPGGEYSHISRTFGAYRLAFVGAWLKMISYIGALAFLSSALADYVIEISAGVLRAPHRLPLAMGSLIFFYLIHAAGVRWFGRLQVAMCAVLGLSLFVLLIPGLFAIRPANYQPFFTHGAAGFASGLPALFFAYAGFESIAQAAGEVKESTRRLPAIVLKGLCGTTVIYVLMSVVALGVLPGERLAASTAPMAEAAAIYLPVGAAWFVNLGAIMAIATSVNATMLVPSRLAISLAEDRLIPSWLGAVHAGTGTPLAGLTLTLAVAALLLASGQIGLALNVAVFALVLLYLLHSLALLLLPRLNPQLYRSATAGISPGVQRAAAVTSIATMGALALLQVMQDLRVLRNESLSERIAGQSLTSVELVLVWGLLGLAMYLPAARRARAQPAV